MTAASIPVAGTTASLQTFRNTIGGTAVDSEAVTLTDQTGAPITGSNPLPVSGTVTTGGLTDTQLRATPVPISGTVTANGTANQGTPAAYTNRWPVQLADASGHLSNVSTNGAVNVIAVDGNGHTQVLAATGETLVNIRDASGHTANVEVWGALDVNILDSAGHTLNVEVGGSLDTVLKDASGNLSKVNTDGSLPVAAEANATSVGSTPYCNTALSSTKQAVKASAGNLYGYHIYNPNTATCFVQMFDVASGGVTVGSTAPTFVLTIPSNSSSPATLDCQMAVPIRFGTALTIAATTTATGSGTPSTALVCSLFYA